MNYYEGEDSLRMEIIHEEDESNAAKISMLHLDPLTFELTGSISHDSNLLNQSLKKLKGHIESKIITKSLAKHQFDQLRDKLDKFIKLHANTTKEYEIQIIGELFNEVNSLFSFFQESYEGQSEHQILDSKELQSSQLEYFKKRSSEHVQKRSLSKVSLYNPISQVFLESDRQQGDDKRLKEVESLNYFAPSYEKIEIQQVDKNLLTKNNQFKHQNLRVNNNQDEQLNFFDNAKSQHLISSAGIGIGEQQNNLLNISQVSILNEPLIQENFDDFDMFESTINHPKVFHIKANSFNIFKESPKIAIETPNSNEHSKQINLPLIEIQKEECNTKQHDDQMENQSQNQDKSVNSNSNTHKNNPLLPMFEQEIQKISTREDEKDIPTYDYSKPNRDLKADQQQAKQFQQSLEEEFAEIERLFDEKLINEVEEKRKNLINKIGRMKQTNEGNKKSIQMKRVIEQFERAHEKQMKYYENINIQVENSVFLLAQKEGWKLEGDKHGFQIQYKIMPETKMIALRLETDSLQISIQTLIAIIYEIELYSEWFPFCTYGKNLKTVDKACKIVHLKMDPPFVSDREVYIHGMGVDRLKIDGSIIIMARSIDKDRQMIEECEIEIPEKTKCVRVDIPYFTFQIKPINNNKLMFSSVSNFDPHLKFIPDSVINLVTRKFARFLFERMVNQHKKFKGSKWEKNTLQNPEFYNWIENKCKHFYQK